MSATFDIERFLERTGDGVRIRGTRVDLATIVEAYHQGWSPEEIAYNYPTARLEAVYAAIAYYLADRAEIDRELGETARVLAERRTQHPLSPVVERLRALIHDHKAS